MASLANCNVAMAVVALTIGIFVIPVWNISTPQIWVSTHRCSISEGETSKMILGD